MEAVGTLAGGIAHDFNNLLQAIQGYSDLLLLDKNKDDPGYRELQEIRRAGQRASELTQQLLTFSQKVESRLRPVNLNHEVTEVENLLKRTIPKMIRIELHLADTLGTINADPAQIEQVIMNLGVNARDAMPEGGTLIIETQDTTLDEQYCSTHLGAIPGDYVLLTISDTGHGMDNETLEHIFEPFYTTKETGKGTGLGLAMVYGIVKGHHGYITYCSEPGEGTTFKIYLPVIRPEGKAQNAEHEDNGVIIRGTETVLLVDDEEPIRELGKDTLARFGYTVIMAPDGESALELYREKNKEIDLIILDLIMPGMGGRKCLERLLKINPQARVLIASGYSVNGPTKEALAAGARGFISKPYDLTQMLKAVREALDKE
jgi:CheY-like chemotaxis protein